MTAREDNLPSAPRRRNPAAPIDDDTFQRAFRRSSVVIVAIFVVGASIIWSSGRRRPPATTEAAPVVVPEIRDLPRVEIPAVTFTDVTREAGIDFVHCNGAYGEKLLPETMGSGCAFFDYDNDVHQDLLMINSCSWPWHPMPAGGGSKRPSIRLYHNDGHGHFADVTAGSGLDISLYGTGVAVGDYDNDGLVDVYITAVGKNHLFRNLGGGKFADVTDRAGVGGRENQWSTSCGFFDYDGDGRLDLFVCNYVEWSRDVDLAQSFVLTGIGRAYGPPANFAGAFPYVFHNDGNGHFTDVSRQSGVQVVNPATGRPMAKSLGVTFADVDGDGRIDILVANDTVQNFLFRNLGNGKFEEIGVTAGIGFDSSGVARGAMGIDAARFRNDTALGVAISNFANEMMGLYVSPSPGSPFTDEAVAAGIGPATRLDLSFGLLWFDYDLDGRLDILSANGHLEQDISRVQAALTYRQPLRLFWNAGPSHPTEMLGVPAEKCGPDFSTPIVGRGAAYADIDGDGDLDLIVTQVAGPPLLLRNNLDGAAHYLRFKLIGTTDNRDAIGAWVEVDTAGQTLRRQVMPTRSYLSQVELPVTVGLGKRTGIDEVRVRWPNGSVQKVQEYRLDRLTVVRQQPSFPGTKASHSK